MTDSSLPSDPDDFMALMATVIAINAMKSSENNESYGKSTLSTDAGISFLVDCIVSLKPVEIESTVRKALVVWKMRGSDHDKRLREYEITSHGVEVSTPFSDYEGLLTGSPRRSITEQAANNWAMAFAKNKQKHS